jgi:hypothetical protein
VFGVRFSFTHAVPSSIHRIRARARAHFPNLDIACLLDAPVFRVDPDERCTNSFREMPDVRHGKASADLYDDRFFRYSGPLAIIIMLL